MILVGITGGMRQGKSSVGSELRRLAGVDAKADLEFSYPIGQVCNAWVQSWPPEVIRPNESVVVAANRLLPLLVDPVKELAGQDLDADKLVIEDTPASRELNNRLLSYLQAYDEAGEARDEEFPVPITPDNKVLHRKLYQWIGARLIDVLDTGSELDVWSLLIEKRIKTLETRDYALVTVAGVRYPGHYQMVRNNGGHIVRVERPGVVNDDDVTERAGDSEKPDVMVVNNGTLDELNAAVGALYQDLLDGSAKAKYRAA